MQSSAKLITEPEQAKLLSCSQRHLIRMRNCRMIPFVKLGKAIRYNPEAVARALEKLTVKERI
jgi:hypothetical protein